MDLWGRSLLPPMSAQDPDIVSELINGNQPEAAPSQGSPATRIQSIRLLSSFLFTGG